MVVILFLGFCHKPNLKDLAAAPAPAHLLDLVSCDMTPRVLPVDVTVCLTILIKKKKTACIESAELFQQCCLFSQETYKLPHRLIEKKRRDRINECIAQLKDLLPEHLKLTVSSRNEG